MFFGLLAISEVFLEFKDTFMNENSCLLIDTHIPRGSMLSDNCVTGLWKSLCESIPALQKISVDLAKSRIVDNIQRKDFISLQIFISKIPDDYTVIMSIISVSEDYFVKQNILSALPVSVRGMCEVGQHVKIYNLI